MKNGNGHTDPRAEWRAHRTELMEGQAATERLLAAARSIPEDHEKGGELSAEESLILKRAANTFGHNWRNQFRPPEPVPDYVQRAEAALEAANAAFEESKALVWRRVAELDVASGAGAYTLRTGKRAIFLGQPRQVTTRVSREELRRLEEAAELAASAEDRARVALEQALSDRGDALVRSQEMRLRAQPVDFHPVAK